VIRSFFIVTAIAVMSVCLRAQDRASGPGGEQEDAARPVTPYPTPLRSTEADSTSTTTLESTTQDPPATKLHSPEEVTQYQQSGQQPKRILWIIPNYRAVSANTTLPPMTFKDKLWLATEDTFDYSNFIFVGSLAGISMSQNSEPSFGHGAAGYGRYYWHIFVDGAVENYLVEAFVPAATKEDPRYYTLGHGRFLKRTGYAVSRLFVTRNDAGRNTFNISEVVGAGAAAGIGNLYYPRESNQWVKTYQRWGTQIALDGLFNILKEFWPDIDRIVFHGKY
jgi:hypothetical protein